MPQCDELKRMCRQEPSISICPLDSGHDNNDDDSSPDSPNHQSGPLMKMFFHFGYSDYVLFDFWVPRTPYHMPLRVCFALSWPFAYEGLLVISIHLELQWENMLSKRLIYSTSMKDALDSDSSNDDIIVNGPSSITNVNSGIFEDDAPLLRPRSRNGRTRDSIWNGPHIAISVERRLPFDASLFRCWTQITCRKRDPMTPKATGKPTTQVRILREKVFGR
ncbi:hypothetical protein BASA81_009263 [Batrachochytrium salamandrivorans]|nr:hypothetical protein BASA81_009263 [Batrachochytrium salamandrivorans]